jgi:hypothetical protein
MFCSWSAVPEVIWSEKDPSSTSWLQQCYQLKSSCSVAKNTETTFSPLHQLYCTSLWLHMCYHISHCWMFPLNVFHSLPWSQQHLCFCSLSYLWVTTVVHPISSNSTRRNLTGLNHVTKLAMSPVHLFLSTFLDNFLSSTHSTSAKLWKHSILCDFRLPPWCKWDQYSSGILHSTEL